ncbi:BON domain-containing protein [Billgrantia antri]|uniref:BON domain-containing protein n=1 Tax=Billgrantia antri TaxID=2846777 RepID=A0ABS6ZTC3_9GAMM|nr:BON domain-containing protein [Halomonas antri]MBW6393083.1 BON domain-containing protein [Halomonas antri]
MLRCRRLMPLALPGLLLLVLAACTVAPVNETARLEQQDSLAAVQIKARLLEAPDLAGSAIDVDLAGDRAILTGFVETEEQRERAATLTREQDGVAQVDNRITVK